MVIFNPSCTASDWYSNLPIGYYTFMRIVVFLPDVSLHLSATKRAIKSTSGL